MLPAQQILKALPPLFESKDAKARDKVKEIVVSAAQGWCHRRGSKGSNNTNLRTLWLWQAGQQQWRRHPHIRARCTPTHRAHSLCLPGCLPGPHLCLLGQAELARWMGSDLIRAALFEKMRDAMKEDVEKLLQVTGVQGSVLGDECSECTTSLHPQACTRMRTRIGLLAHISGPSYPAACGCVC